MKSSHGLGLGGQAFVSGQQGEEELKEIYSRMGPHSHFGILLV